jgi:hypothetical protein
MSGNRKAKAAVRNTNGFQVQKRRGNCEVIMPGKSVRVNNPEVAREHVTYGESNGGQSGKLTA